MPKQKSPKRSHSLPWIAMKKWLGVSSSHLYTRYNDIVYVYIKVKPLLFTLFWKELTEQCNLDSSEISSDKSASFFANSYMVFHNMAVPWFI